jgi:hypothetical protein
MDSYVAAGVVALTLALSPARSAAHEGSPGDEARAEDRRQPVTAQPPPAGAPAAEPQDAEAKRKLEAEIAKELGAAPGASTPPAAAPGAEPAAPQQGTTGSSPYARLLLLPDLSAIGSAAGVFDSLDVARRSPRSGPSGPEGRPEFLFEELELGVQAVVDPYVRADVFLSFGPDGAGVEEAYVTTLTLPASLQVRGGTFFVPFGRLNTQHPHVWDFVDAPLALDRVVAGGKGEDKLAGPGVEVAWLAPLPWFAELRISGQSTAIDPAAPPGLTGAARLGQFFLLGDATTVGVGLSAARRAEPGPGAFRDLGGVDLLVKHRPLQTRSYVTLQGELYGRRLRGAGGATDGGGYAQLFVRRGPYLGYGVRYDQAPATGEEVGTGAEQRFGAVAVWYLSEFQRIRLQGSYDRLPDGKDGLEALLHLEFGLGAHGAHPF